MREELIKTSLDAVILSDTASKRMYDSIITKYRERQKKTARSRIIVPAAACAALAAFGASFAGVMLSREKAGASVETYGYLTDAAENGISGDGTGGFTAPLSQNTGIVLYGADLTDGEGYAYLCENFGSIKSSLSSSGVAVSDMNIYEHGYRHIKCENTQDVTQYSVNSGFRDYLIYNGDTLVSIVTVTKDDDGRIGSSMSFGADEYYRALDTFIKANGSTEMIFLYAGSYEIILTENSEPFCPVCDVSALFKNISEPFEEFYNKEAVFTP